MNILHLEASPGWGGQEIRILREAEGMRSRGHALFFVVETGGRLAKEARKAGFFVKEFSFKKNYWPLTLVRLLTLIKRNKIEIINTHSSLDSWIGGIAARLARKKVVRTRHLSTPIKSGWNSRWLYGRLADFVVTTCAEIIPTIVVQSGKPKELIRSIPTGVDPRNMKTHREEVERIRFSLGVKEGDFLVGTACFMRSWKGIFDLLQAAYLLRAQKNVRWIVIGGGHERIYRERAEQLNLQENVIFTGHLANPIPVLDALDAFALLSTAHEGVSQAILQASYLKKPLIATPTGGLKEVCIHNQTGISVPPFSPDQVAEAVKTLMNQRELCQRLGLQAHDLVMSCFTLERMLDQMEEVYDEVSSQRFRKERKETIQ